MRLVESMHRQLPVLLARAVVASSTSQAGSSDNTLKDKKHSGELSEAAAIKKACEVQVTITVKIEKGKDQTPGKIQKTRDKRRNNESSSESEENHKDDEQRKSRSSDSEIRLSRFSLSEDQCDCGSAQASRITVNNPDEENANGNNSDNVVKDATAKFFWI